MASLAETQPELDHVTEGEHGDDVDVSMPRPEFCPESDVSEWTEDHVSESKVGKDQRNVTKHHTMPRAIQCSISIKKELKNKGNFKYDNWIMTLCFMSDITNASWIIVTSNIVGLF